MADRRTARTVSPAVRTTSRSRGSGIGTGSSAATADVSFEEQERARIRQLKEDLLRSRSPPGATPISPPAIRYSRDGYATGTLSSGVAGTTPGMTAGATAAAAALSSFRILAQRDYGEQIDGDEAPPLASLQSLQLQMQQSLAQTVSTTPVRFQPTLPSSQSREQQQQLQRDQLLRDQQQQQQQSSSGAVAPVSSSGRSLEGRAAGPVEFAAAQDVIRDDTDQIPPQRLFTDGETVCVRCLRAPSSAPILLSCGHRLCAGCAVDLFHFHVAVDALARRVGAPVELRCLDCGAGTTVTDLDSLTGRTESAPDRLHCCVCREAEATAWCNNCQAPFCADCCGVFHARSDHFQRHKSVELDALHSKRRCALHSKNLDMFCSSCLQPCCARCFLSEDGQHRGHVALPLDVAAGPVAAALRSSIAATRDAADHLGGMVQQLRGAVDSVGRAHDDSAETVRQYFMALRTALQQREAALLGELTSARDYKIRVLEQQGSAVGALANELRAAAAAAERAADLSAGPARDLAVLSLSSRLEQRRNLATALEPRCRPPQSVELRVELPREPPPLDRLGSVVK